MYICTHILSVRLFDFSNVVLFIKRSRYLTLWWWWWTSGWRVVLEFGIIESYRCNRLVLYISRRCEFILW